MISKALNWLFILVLIGLAGHYIYKLPRFKEGNLAPDFTTQTLDNKSFQLSKRAPSQYTLLSFWGSWCAPCRRKNKEITSLSRMYPVDQLQIITLPIEKNTQSMLKAIETDSLAHLTHLPQMDYFSSEVAKLYGVREIPTSYLIDPKNNVIGVNLSAKEVIQILSVN